MVSGPSVVQVACLHVTLTFAYAFPQYLFSPLVEKLGYEFGENDSPDVRQLRTLAYVKSPNSPQ
jgi:hypothetical protein